MCAFTRVRAQACRRVHAPTHARRTHRLPWAVNTTVVQPGGRLLCSVGDDPDALVFDPGQRGTRAAVQLAGGHVDFSFAAAWHPDGNVLATGNQVRRGLDMELNDMGHQDVVCVGKEGGGEDCS